MRWKIVAKYAVALYVATFLVAGFFGVFDSYARDFMGGVPAWSGFAWGWLNLLTVSLVCLILARRHPERAWAHAMAAVVGYALIDYATLLPMLLSGGHSILDNLVAAIPRWIWLLVAMSIGVSIGHRFPAAPEADDPPAG